MIVSGDNVDGLLRGVFGFDSFRSGQQEIIDAVLAGGDVFAIMPTGSGKSLCYQLPALVSGGVTVVVSPLIALMRDQLAHLSGLGIEAASLNSSNDGHENRTAEESLRRGDLRLIYLAPERLARGDTVQLLAMSGVTRLVIDEAHCVSQWGHDFRPEYLAIGAVRDALARETGGRVQTVAFTATADAATRADVARRLFPSPPRIFIGSLDRPNLSLAMRPRAGGARQVVDFVRDRAGQSGIVYCNSRKKTESLAEALADKGIAALAYHAGMDKAMRDGHQDAFLKRDGVVMVATIAFGMGIDKPDVRFVCHADLPRSIEAYYQEIGRAGRDGLPAETLTLWGLDDVRFRRRQIEESAAGDDQKRIDRKRLGALLALCEAPRCRRQTLLAYFGETAEEPCGNCDLCLGGVSLRDGTIDAQKAMSAILRTGQVFGLEHLVNLLLGTETDAILTRNHHLLPTFGVGKGVDRDHWRSVFRQLFALGLIDQVDEGYASWRLTEAGSEVLRGRKTVELRAEPVLAKGKRRQGVWVAAEADADLELLAALKALRTALATAEGVPAYVVFPDRSLVEMATRRPANLTQMAGIHGVGSRKLERYGQTFLDAIVEAAAGKVTAA